MASAVPLTINRRNLGMQTEIVRDVHFHVKDTESMSFPLGVRFQRLTATATQRIMQDEIQGQQIGSFIANDIAKTDLLEMLLDALDGQLLADDFVPFRAVCDDTDVAAVSLVT